MKIGIVTITNGPDNYGNILQNFAVQHMALELGHEPETINNISYMEHRRNNLYLIPKLFVSYRKTCKSIKFLQYRKRYLKFSDFYVTSNTENLNDLSVKYDKFLCGSDQIWNPKYGFNSNWDFGLLKFAKPNQKVAIAASFGVSSLDEAEVEIFKSAFDDFHRISVRELSAKKIINDICQKEPTLLIDPTMMISAEIWEKQCKCIEKLKNKKFIVQYILGEMPLDFVKRYEQQDEYEIINLLDLNSKYYSSGPDEFLWLIKNAEAIITDSFHATVFSILFKKRFIVLKRDGIFDRLETLLKQFDFTEKIYGKDKNLFAEISKEKWECVDEMLQIQKEKATAFLKEALL